MRELHFYFGSVRLRDVARALLAQLAATHAVARFEAAFARTVGAVDAVSFAAGRMAFYAILEALQVGEGDEVIVPAFTCVVVPNAVRYRGARPVFVDVDPVTWNIDPRSVERALTERTRVILVQHTFGVPADIDAVARIVRPRGIRIVEDCAHAIGGTAPDGRQLGTIGDAGFFSFESTKPLTLGRGGIAVSADASLLSRIRAVQRALPAPGRIDSLKAGIRLFVLALLHRPSVFRFGKFAAALLFRGHVFHPNITTVERCGDRPAAFPARMTTFQAVLGMTQLRRLPAVNAHRAALAERYDRGLRELGLTAQAHAAGLPLLRASFHLSDPDAAVARFAEEQVELGRWFDSPVVPVRYGDPEFGSTGYRLGSCPVAEAITTTCVNLPTDPIVTARDADRALAVLRTFVEGRART